MKRRSNGKRAIRKEKGKARSSIAHVISLQRKGKARHLTRGTSQDHADLSLRSLKITGWEHGQHLCRAVPVERALGSRGLVPTGRDGEQEAVLLCMLEPLKCRNI